MRLSARSALVALLAALALVVWWPALRGGGRPPARRARPAPASPTLPVTPARRAANDAGERMDALEVLLPARSQRGVADLIGGAPAPESADAWDELALRWWNARPGRVGSGPEAGSHSGAEDGR